MATSQTIQVSRLLKSILFRNGLIRAHQRARTKTFLRRPLSLKAGKLELQIWSLAWPRNTRYRQTALFLTSTSGFRPTSPKIGGSRLLKSNLVTDAWFIT